MVNLKSGSSRPRTRSLPTPRDRRLFEALRVHSHLSTGQIRRLFFRKNGSTAAAQTVSTRLRKLVDAGYLTTVVVDRGRGAGPYAYALSLAGKALLGATSRRGRPSTGPVWHDLEVAEFRVVLSETLQRRAGRIIEWVGEPQLRALIRQPAAPIPDALVHWRLRDREGTFLLEWDRGTETLAVLTAKLSRYTSFLRSHGHQRLLPGLGLRPRLVIVTSRSRAGRLQVHVQKHPLPVTVMIGADREVLGDPLMRVWWRSDTEGPGTLVG